MAFSFTTSVFSAEQICKVDRALFNIAGLAASFVDWPIFKVFSCRCIMLSQLLVSNIIEKAFKKAEVLKN